MVGGNALIMPSFTTEISPKQLSTLTFSNVSVRRRFTAERYLSEGVIRSGFLGMVCENKISKYLYTNKLSIYISLPQLVVVVVRCS